MLKRIFVEVLVEASRDDPNFVPELEIRHANTRAELPYRGHSTLTALIQKIMTRLHASPCRCCRTDDLSAPIPGVTCSIENGKIAEHSDIARCDVCEWFKNDKTAEAALRIYLANDDFYSS